MYNYIHIYASLDRFSIPRTYSERQLLLPVALTCSFILREPGGPSAGLLPQQHHPHDIGGVATRWRSGA